jgi:hypothetical protein
MGWWLLMFWLDAGVPASVSLYTGLDKQRCLTVVQEHLQAQEARPDRYVESLYVGCVQGSRPRRM